MAKNMQPIAKRCHALGISPAVMGYAKKTTHRNPGSQARRTKGEYVRSSACGYALQLQGEAEDKFHGILGSQLLFLLLMLHRWQRIRLLRLAPIMA